jgi:hypothetical protein
MEDSTGIVDMFSQATKYVYMEWLYLLLIYLWVSQDGSEVSHSDSWRIGNTPTFYAPLYRFQFPYINKKG